jgi:hypothetical protein
MINNVLKSTLFVPIDFPYSVSLLKFPLCCFFLLRKFGCVTHLYPKSIES